MGRKLDGPNRSLESLGVIENKRLCLAGYRSKLRAEDRGASLRSSIAAPSPIAFRERRVRRRRPCPSRPPSFLLLLFHRLGFQLVVDRDHHRVQSLAERFRIIDLGDQRELGKERLHRRDRRRRWSSRSSRRLPANRRWLPPIVRERGKPPSSGQGGPGCLFAGRSGPLS